MVHPSHVSSEDNPCSQKGSEQDSHDQGLGEGTREGAELAKLRPLAHLETGKNHHKRIRNDLPVGVFVLIV